MDAIKVLLASLALAAPLSARAAAPLPERMPANCHVPVADTELEGYGLARPTFLDAVAAAMFGPRVAVRLAEAPDSAIMLAVVPELAPLITRDGTVGQWRSDWCAQHPGGK